MKPLIVLLIVFVLSLVSLKLFKDVYDFTLAGKIAMAAMLLFTAVGHFIFSEGMTMMLPEFIPYKKAVVYFTGILEVAAAVGLFIPNIQRLTAWLLIVFFILILPANVRAAIHQINYENGTLNGNDINYLWFRIPLQIFFILWIYFSAIHKQ